MNMKSIVLRLFALLLSVSLFTFTYVHLSGAYDWLIWSKDDFKLRSETGTIKDAYWSGGKRSCQCTVLKVENEEGIFTFYADLTKSQREKIDRQSGDYIVKYYPSGNGENTTVAILDSGSEKELYKSDIYTGYGVALSSAIFAMFMFCVGGFAFLLSTGIVKSDDQGNT